MKVSQIVDECHLTTYLVERPRDHRQDKTNWETEHGGVVGSARSKEASGSNRPYKIYLEVIISSYHDHHITFFYPKWHPHSKTSMVQ